LAAERGVQDALKERFLAATFTEGAAIGEVDELARLAVEVGLDGDEVGAVLAGDRYSAEVRGDEQRARAFGVSGVPFFVMGGRYGVSGAQPSDLLLQVLRDTWSETEHPLASVGGSDAASCTNDACVVPS
jgi:predicted DsbA family dithiol-disulfide isomerase